MRTSRPLLRTPHFSMYVVSCAAHHRGWSPPEQATVAGLVLPRRGTFRVASEGRRQIVDVTAGYLQAPGHEHRFAHPAGGDECTFITVQEPLWDTLVGPAPLRVAVDARLELAHRMLLRAGHDAADPLERLVHTLAAAVRPYRPQVPPGRADLADRAREAIVAGDEDAADLVRLARALDVSPPHLSRTFHAHVGMTVSRFRNRVRISRVLARVEEGETDLAALASAVGFADQAHLSRAVRAELGRPPGRLRTLFTPGRPGRGPAGRT